MHIFEITPTLKTKKWLAKNRIDTKAMQYALSSIYSDIKRSNRFKKTKITLQVDYNSDCSSYCFGTNKIYICSDPDFLAKTRKQKIFVIFLHFLHEFRHWMQSEVLGIKDSQVKYNEYDLNNNTNRYYRNKFEVDARKFERKYIRKFMRYYVTFKRAYQ